MPELIDKQATLKKMCETCGYCERFEKAVRSTHPDFVADKCNAYKFLADQPTIEAEPVRHGRWIESQTDLICSVCKWKYNDELPFMSNNGLDSMTEAFAHCPHCGARMDATDTNVGGKGGADNG